MKNKYLLFLNWRGINLEGLLFRKLVYMDSIYSILEFTLALLFRSKEIQGLELGTGPLTPNLTQGTKFEHATQVWVR